jgi:hypothetical protein
MLLAHPIQNVHMAQPVCYGRFVDSQIRNAYMVYPINQLHVPPTLGSLPSLQRTSVWVVFHFQLMAKIIDKHLVFSARRINPMGYHITLALQIMIDIHISRWEI